ncbi:heme-binding protein [Roseibium salinum]|uniref:Heme-binding protein n=1 Tax=Roseibium salinum TaxID=1604349 RepID=A0ABT3R977_9HYPH|nr:heme-binding protein [Roseibium sp. DSM 29163]MCX2725856.1 heme-binding protein [Roseibium sp. DSM 29163]MDN3720329.1 heme-binding protein [Roseibium salinum]
MRRIVIFLGVILFPVSALSQSAAVHTVSVLDLQVALRAALRAVEVCSEAGHQAAASVVDRFGVEQVTLRNNMAGAHAAEAARRKAWTAASFNMPTSEIDETETGGDVSGTTGIPREVPIGGGLPIVSQSGELLGGIGVAGGGSGETEAKCARAGLDAIADQLK